MVWAQQAAPLRALHQLEFRLKYVILNNKMRYRLHYFRLPLLIITALTILGPAVLMAQDSDATRRKIEHIDREIQAERERLERSRQAEGSIFAEFQAIDNLVGLEARKDNELRNRIGEIEFQMQANVTEEARLAVIIQDQRRRLGRRFRAMYIDGPSSLIELALNAESFSDLSRRDMFYRSLAKADAGLIEEYRSNLKVLRDVQKKLEVDRSHLIALQKDVENTRRELEKERAGKAELLRAAREDRDTHLRVIAELEATSRRAGGVIARNERKEEEERKAEEARRLAAIEAARNATPEARQHSQEPAVAVAEPPAPAVEPPAPRHEAAVEVPEPPAPPKPSETPEQPKPAETPEQPKPPETPEPQEPPRMMPTIPALEPRAGGFAAQRGRMCGPSVGPVLHGYGMQRNPKFGTTTYSKGVAIGAPAGAPIRAVWDGEVVYAGWFSGYGKILIVNHGDHYYTLYAHASSLLKSSGQTVKRGEVIARVGDTGSLEGPQVYFEVRQGSSSLNPSGWVRFGC